MPLILFIFQFKLRQLQFQQRPPQPRPQHKVNLLYFVIITFVIILNIKACYQIIKNVNLHAW
jgi:hypothetical protein